MSKRDDIKKKIEEEEKMSSGEGTLGSGSVDLEADDDVEEAKNQIIENQSQEEETEE